MLLYNSQVSGNCYKVRLLFAHLGIDYEKREVDVIDRSGRRELLGELNPALRVPTLVLDDGRSLGESNAIISYFAEGTEYLPDDRFERAQVLQWLFFEQYSHEPYIAVARFWRIAGIHAGAGRARGQGARRPRGARGARRQAPDHEFLVGDRYSIADIALYAYTHVAPEGGFELEPYPASAPGWRGCRPSRATSRSPIDSSAGPRLDRAAGLPICLRGSAGDSGRRLARGAPAQRRALQCACRADAPYPWKSGSPVDGDRNSKRALPRRPNWNMLFSVPSVAS